MNELEISLVDTIDLFTTPSLPLGKLESLLRRYAEGRLKGRRVRLLRGRYKGREGIIDGVTITESHGTCALVNIYRRDGQPGFLDGDAETRTYWPLRALEEIE